MDFIRLTDPAAPEFETAFALYEVSFPVHEQRTRPAQAARLSHPEYRYMLLYEGDQFQGTSSKASSSIGRAPASGMWSTSPSPRSCGAGEWVPVPWRSCAARESR